MTDDRSRFQSVVALLADIPSTGHLGDVQAQRFSLDGDDLAARSEDFLDYCTRRLGEQKKVVALYPAWRGTRAERVVGVVRGSLQSDGIAAIGMDMSPLALSLIADQLAYLAPYMPAGMIAALADELPGHTLAGGWLKSVGNLEHIPITVKQHIGSLAPKVNFLGFCAPVKRVGRVKNADPAPNIPARPLEPIQILVSGSDKIDQAEFTDQFIPTLGCQMAGRLPEQPLGSTYWGTTKYLEFVAFSAHPQALTNPIKGVRATACLWCRELVAGVHCRFCGGANQLPAVRPPAQEADVPSPPAKSTGEHIRPSWVGAQGNEGEQQAPAADRRSPDAAAGTTAQADGSGDRKSVV